MARRHRLSLACVALALAAFPVDGAGQDADSLRARFRIPVPPAIEVLQAVSRTPPGTSAGSPTAFGPGWGDVFFGGGVVNRQRFDPGDNTFRDRVDGSIVAGFGLGDPAQLVGIEVAIASFSTFDSGFGTRAGVSLKLHRLLPGNWGVAIGAENALTRGQVDADPSYYGVVSHSRGRLSASLGIGDGRFRFEDDMLADRDRVNAFGSLSVRVFEPLSLIADWTGQDLTLAASVVPFASVPLIVTTGLADVTGTAGDGVRVTLGMGVGLQL